MRLRHNKANFDASLCQVLKKLFIDFIHGPAV